ncbi:hypothetical protein TMatcc_007053 [Talaromyces marneffei ATCC 18224]
MGSSTNNDFRDDFALPGLAPPRLPGSLSRRKPLAASIKINIPEITNTESSRHRTSNKDRSTVDALRQRSSETDNEVIFAL